MITYLLTVALHAAVLSVVASLILLVVRQARFRAVIALYALLAVGILPWITALRPAPAPVVVSQEIPAASTPTALPVWTVVTLPAEMPVAAPSVSQLASVPIGFALFDPLKSAITLWAAGAVIGLLLLGIAWLRQRHWRNSLETIDDASWTKLQATDSSLLDRNVFLLTSSAVSPCVTGFRLPRVVLPRFLFADDSATALVWALRHELSHLRAGDSRWMLVLSLVRCLHWWNPLVHHLVTRWADAREQLCDLAGAEIPASRSGYGQFLVAMAGRIHRRPPLNVAMVRRAPARRLKSRIVSLLDAEPGADRPVGKRFVGLSLVGFMAVGVLVSVLNIRAEEAAVENDLVVQIPVEEKLPEIHPDEKPTIIPESEGFQSPEPRTGELTQKSKPIQLKFTARFIAFSPRSTTPDGTILDAADLAEFMKKASQIEGATLLTAPSVTALPGQQATIEIIREVLGTREQYSAIKPGTPVPFVGIRLGFNSTLKDGLAELESGVSYRFIPGVFQPISDSNSGYGALHGANPDDIKIFDRKTSACLKSGMTLVADIGEIEPGTFLQMFVTVESINSTGRTTVGFTDDTLVPEESEPHRSEVMTSEKSLTILSRSIDKFMKLKGMEVRYDTAGTIPEFDGSRDGLPRFQEDHGSNADDR